MPIDWLPCVPRGPVTLRWHHNGRDSVSNHQPHDCLLHHLFRHRSKKTPKLRVTGLCTGNSLGTGEFPAQMASNMENVSIWWHHHESGRTQKVNTFSLIYMKDLWEFHQLFQSFDNTKFPTSHCPFHWSDALSREWRCSWSSADRRSSNCIWMMNKFMAYWGVAHIRGFVVLREANVQCRPVVINAAADLSFIIPPLQRSWKGVYWYHLVRLSVCGQTRVCSVSSRILIGSISYSHILSSNFRRCARVMPISKFKNLKFWRIF